MSAVTASDALGLSDREYDRLFRCMPQDGPQRMAADSEADIVILGGQGGGGKSWIGCYEGAKHLLDPEVRGFHGVMFRRTSPQLTGGGGLFDETRSMYPRFGGTPQKQPLQWTFPAMGGRPEDTHRIELRHLQYESDVYDHQGLQYAFIFFDELVHFTAHQFWYLLSRLRSMCGVRPYLRATCNPDPHSFVRELIDWWIGEDGYPIPERAGVLRWFVRVENSLDWYDSREAALEEHPGSDPQSLTFIPARLMDNPILTSIDPGYRGRLLALPLVERMRLLGDDRKGGNWNEQGEGGLYFDRRHIKLVSEAPSRVVFQVRFWDKASTRPNPKNPRPDWTRGVLLSACENGEILIDDIVSAQESPAKVLQIMRATAERDGIGTAVGWWIDSAGAGKTDHETTEAAMVGFRLVPIDSHSSPPSLDSSKARSSTAKRAWARAWSPVVAGPAADGVDGRVYMRRNGVERFVDADGKECTREWTEVALREIHQFPHASHDDIVDALSGAMQVVLNAGLWVKPPPSGDRRESPARRAAKYV